MKVVGQQSSISTIPIPIPYYIRNIRIWGDLMLHISQKRSCLFECDCMVLCLHMCVIFPACKSSVFVFLVIRVPDSGSGSALQYLVLPKPNIVSACLREFVCFCVYHSCSRVLIISGNCCAGVCVSCIQSSGIALQYLVPPKPTIVPAGIQPSHSSLWSLT